MYHIFDKDSVDMICREYGGDPRVMIIALNDAVNDQLRNLAEAAIKYHDAETKTPEGDFAELNLCVKASQYALKQKGIL